MAILSLTNVNKSFGERDILKDISFEVNKNEHIGFVGVNGCGKTTLFKIITSEYSLDTGNVKVAPNSNIGYMQQHVCADLSKTVYEETLSVFDKLIEAECEIERINNLILNGEKDDDIILRQSELLEFFEANGGLTFKSRSKSTLLGLGFTENDINLPISALSGGERAKIQLARLLLSKSDMLLLDEPTNHLDIKAIEWLENFLISYQGAFIVVSHDRYFLDKVSTRTLYLKDGILRSYSGNYTEFVRKNEAENKEAKKKYELTKKEIDRLYGIVEQQRQWNREKNIKTAESKLKVISRLEETLVEPEKQDKSMRFEFKDSSKTGNDVLKVNSLSLSYDGKSIYKDVSFNIYKGERVFLIGANGCGKTSLFKTIMGTVQKNEGNVYFGSGVIIGYYDQIQANVSSEKNVINELHDSYPKITTGEIRNILASFLFFGDDVYKNVSDLSGGERARLLLAKLSLSGCNFLLLDEPTNHLDIASAEALEKALENYTGTLFVISHDRYLINRIANRFFVMENGNINEFYGTYDDYAQTRLKEEEVKPIKKEKAVPQHGIRETEAELKRINSLIKEKERKIAENENAIALLSNEISLPENSANYTLIMEKSQELEKLQNENEDLFLEWSSLSEEYEEKNEALNKMLGGE